MNRKASTILVSVLVILSTILSACQAQPTLTPEKIIETVIVEKEGATVIVTQVVKEIVKETVQAPTPEPAEAAGKVLRLWGGSSDIPSIDPSHATQVIEIQVIGATNVPVVRQNEETGEVENGLASSYEVSDDGLVFTFHLMDNVPWVKWDPNQGQVVKIQDCEGNDRLVTADDLKYGIMRTLDPRTASDYAYVLTPYLKGAADFNTAPITDTAKLDELAAAVGVEVVDPQTIKYTFLSPGVYNINIIGLWPAVAQPKWLIEGDDCTEARGERWTEQGFFQGYGPFTLKEWYHDSYLSLAKNPFWPGSDTVPVAKIDEVRYTFLAESTAFAEFEAGNMDSMSIPSTDMDRVMADPNYKEMIHQVVELGTELYIFNHELAPTDDVRVRRALSMSIDRNAITENVLKSNIPAPFYTNPGVAGAPDPESYPDLGVKYDPEGAKALLDEYLAEKGQTADQLKITLLFNTSEDRQRVAEAVQAMWKDNLGIQVELVNQERRVYLETRKEGLHNVIRASWVLDYPDANNFLFEVFGVGGGFTDITDWTEGENYDKFIELITTAQKETDVKKRKDLYAQAEQILIWDEAAIAPLYWYSSPAVTQPYVTYTNSITGYDYWEKWDINK